MMHVVLLVLVAVSTVSADLPGVLTALEVLQEQLDNDFKIAQVHALMDLDNIVKDVERGIAAMKDNPGRATRELMMALTKDVQVSLSWVAEDYRSIRKHLQEAIEIIKEELKPTEKPATTKTIPSK
ncbi:uncharacterized protein [Halyomorpha halys]|uniref:uncharacterized protein n=1 Tax=Halyomorpha halys TaxID=286706 RepID=UPI0006D51A30|nr:uncharacterized protein LOC106682757 [Halyomorpha halys]